MKSWILRIVVVVMLLVLVGILTIIFQPSPQGVPMPSPNGYDDFVAAAAALPKQDFFSDYSQMTIQELATQVAASSNAFALIQAGLQKECRAPVVRPGEDSALLSRLASFKRPAEALAAKSRLALLQGRTNDAVEANLDGVQMAYGIERGGVLIEAWVGMAEESIALQPLSAVIGDLDAATARRAAQRLAELDATAPTAAETLAAEDAFRRSQGLYGELMVAANHFGVGPLGPVCKKFEIEWAAETTRRRKMILQLARRAFEAQHSQPPTNAAELVPDYLSKLPVISSAPPK